jgi:hypothetical protein
MSASSSSARAPHPVTLPFGDSTAWNTPLDVNELAAHVAHCRASASTTTEKGARLEQLMCWLMGHLPGVQARQINRFSANGAQEIDVLFHNEPTSGGFPTFSTRFIGECKNWQHPVDSSDVAWFAWKMRLGGAYQGVLFAANGITSHATRLSRAHSIVQQMNAENPSRQIYVVTLDEIASLRSTEDLRGLFIDKAMGLMSGSPF